MNSFNWRVARAVCAFAAAFSCLPAPAMSPSTLKDVRGTGTRIQLKPEKPKQGQTLEVLITVDRSHAPDTVTFNNKTYKLFPLDTRTNDTSAGALAKAAADEARNGEESGERTEELRSLIGVPADIAPGKYKLTVGEQQQDVTVQSGTFGMQRVRLPKAKDNFISSPGEEDAVDKAKATVTNKQQWSGCFIRPSKARVSTTFGQRRIVNGRLLKDYFHSGIDFAAAQGTPVLATQGGAVILAHSGWRLHGNIVGLDHGQGVVSFYLHLSKIEVKEGQTVKPGQEIGKVGMTGRANGPHLHFSVYVNGDATNPADWFSRVY